jgi:hypothetical protein
VSILSEFEDRVARAVEGVFAGAFRSPVQPVEIAKALAKAMDDARAVGVGKVYVPVAYEVGVSQADADKLGAFRTTLAGELATYLVAHAREQGYHLPAKPRVSFAIDDDLKLGRFRVRSSLAEEGPASQVSAVPPAARTPAASPPSDEARSREDILAGVPEVHVLATVTVSGVDHDVVLKGDRVVVGRLGTSDIPLEDQNVSREHAVFLREGGSWVIEDLDSTNGTYLAEDRVERARLRDGDTIRVGVTQLVFHEPKA